MLTILHVSDVHFRDTDDDGEQARITKALVKAVRSDSWTPDICIFSGDLSYCGAAKELTMGADWLQELTAEFDSVPLFIVPGNHDISRKSFPHSLRYAHQDEVKYREARPTLLESPNHFQPFQDWHAAMKEKLGDRLLTDWTNPFGCVATVQGPGGYSNHFVGLNTAILSRGDRDDGNLAVDIATLNACLDVRRSKEDCTIAVGHHPLSWLADWNGREAGRLLNQEAGANLFLHGHQHDTSGTSTATSLGQSITVYECGAAYQGSKFPQYFAFYNLDFEQREITPRTYVYSPNSGDWVRDDGRSRPMVATIPMRRGPPAPAEAAAGLLAGQPAVSHRPAGDEACVDETRRDVEALSSDKLIELDAFRALNRASAARERMIEFVKRLDVPKEDLFVPTDQLNRIKTVERAVEKVMARRESDPTYSVERLTDLCGFRLVTYFQSGVPRIVHTLLRSMNDRDDALVKTRVNSEGVTIHTSRRDNDPLSIVGRVKDAVRESGVDAAVETRSSDTGYSSVHIVVDVDIGANGGGPSWVPVEFQVRNVMEEVWGQLDYRFRYGTGRGSVAEESWQRHLNVLKAQFDTCVQYLDLVWELASAEATGPVTLVQTGSHSLSRPEQILAICSDLPPDLHSELAAAFELWKQADGSRQFGGDPGAFGRAAHAFGLLLDLASDREDLGMPMEKFRYIILMEQGYMLLMSGDKNDAKAAEEIYSDLLKSGRREDAGTHFRLGQSLRALGRHEDAINSLKKAVDLASHEYEGVYEGERAIIYDRARLSLANSYWMYQSLARREDRLRFLHLAYLTAKSVFTGHLSDDSKFRALNDLIYYAWEHRKVLGPAESDQAELSDVEFARLVDELEKEHARNPPKSYEHYDTLARVHLMLGNKEKACLAAQKVRHWLERAAESRRRRSPGAGTEKFSDSMEGSRYQRVNQVLRWLTSDEERDAFAFAMDLLDDAREAIKYSGTTGE